MTRQPTLSMLPMTETELQRQVTDLAAIYGWSWVHFRPAQTAHGWRTPVQGPLGVGWPDLILVHPHRRRILFVELKTARGLLSPVQKEVQSLLCAAGADVRTWRPSDFSAIQEALAP